MAASNRIPVKQITSWSFSRYTDYKQCPLKCKLKHLDKIQEPPNEAMARGAKLHDEAASYIKGLSSKVPADLKLIKAELTHLRKLMKQKILPTIVEDQWAVKRDWITTQWNNWKECWLRVKLDAAFYESQDVLFVRDWKSGKCRPEEHAVYMEQLELYALTAFKLLPHVKIVKCQLNYVDHGTSWPQEGPMIFTRKPDEARLQKLWEMRIKPMLADKKFAPKPNDKCRFCFYRAGNKANGGGQCKY